MRSAWFAAVALAACAPPGAGDPRSESVNEADPLARPARVLDTAAVLAPAEEAEFAARLAGLERRTGHPMVIVTIASTGGRDIADLTRDLGNRWGIGRPGIDDGIVLLLAMEDRRLRIAIGDGLRAKLPDEAAAAIIRDRMVPRLSRGDAAGAVRAALDEIDLLLSR